MADFEELVAKLKEINVGVMLDMVLNHCSTEHEWFKKALAGDKYYQDFFYLRPAKADGSLPNNWSSKFGGPAWKNLATLISTTSTSTIRPKPTLTGTTKTSEKKQVKLSTFGEVRA